MHNQKLFQPRLSSLGPITEALHCIFEADHYEVKYYRLIPEFNFVHVNNKHIKQVFNYSIVL